MDKETELAIDYLRDGHKDLDGRVKDLELKAVATEEKFVTIFKILDKIDKNTTWIVRLIIGALVLGTLALLIQAGGG